MARPIEDGLKFFYHSVGAASSPEIQAMLSEFGLEGYAFTFMLFERIHRSDSGSIDISPIHRKALAVKYMGIDVEKFNLMLELACSDALKIFIITDGFLSSPECDKRRDKVLTDRQKRRKGSVEVMHNITPTKPIHNSSESKLCESSAEHLSISLSLSSLDLDKKETVTPPLALVPKPEPPKPPPEPIPEDPFEALALKELEEPNGQPWTNSNQWINCGRRPMKKWPHVFLTMGDLATVLRFYEGKLEKHQRKRVFEIANLKIGDDQKAGKSVEFKSMATWLTTWCYREVLEQITKEKYNQRASS